MTDKERGYIQQIAAEGLIVSTLNTSFPAERIFDNENFLSLLYYCGMLTITGTEMDKFVLGIPNNNVRIQYYEYILTESQRDAAIDITELRNASRTMALRGDIHPALTLIAEAYGQVSSVRRYAGDRKVEQMARDTELHLITMQMRCTELLRIEEVALQ